MPSSFLSPLARPALALLALGLSSSLATAQVQTQSIVVNPAGPAVVSLTLIDADTNRPVPGYDPIAPAATLDLSRLPRNLNLRANTAGQVGSVRFGLDRQSSFRVENSAPYALCADQGGDYPACPASVFTPGAHQLTATAYTSAGASGAAGAGVLVNFTVVRSAQQTPAIAVNSLTLIDADTDRPVPGFDPIPAGARLRLSALPRHLNVRANVSGGVGSVRFDLGGGKTTLENEAPFALCVDGRDRQGKKGNYYACDRSVFAPGERRIVVTPFAKMFGGGAAGTALTWTFTVER